MSDGYLYKFNATTYSKSKSEFMGASSYNDGVIQHANATTWYDNYPMEQYYTQTFKAIWSNGWRGDGVKLDETAWYSHVLTGSSTGFRGMYGFDKNAIQAFLHPDKLFGGVTEAKFHLHCYETTTNGSPDVVIGKHSYTSEPSGTWTGQNTDYGDYSTLHVPNQAIGGYWVTLKPSQITMSDKSTAIGGIAMKGESNTDENMGKFSSYSAFDTELVITVLK